MIGSDVLLLPHDEGFQETLLLAWDILNKRASQFCVIGLDGLPRSASEDDLTEYLEGGEYEERQNLIELPYVAGIEF